MAGELSPMIAVSDAQAAIEFYKSVFDAVEFGEMYEWEGKIGHAELDFGHSKLMISDEFPDYNKTPERLGGSPVIINLTVDDTDARLAKAVALGATVIQEPVDQPYGRVAKFRDPFGHIWLLNQQV
jgi:PhnB protein